MLSWVGMSFYVIFQTFTQSICIIYMFLFVAVGSIFVCLSGYLTPRDGGRNCSLSKRWCGWPSRKLSGFETVWCKTSCSCIVIQCYSSWFYLRWRFYVFPLNHHKLAWFFPRCLKQIQVMVHLNWNLRHLLPHHHCVADLIGCEARYHMRPKFSISQPTSWSSCLFDLGILGGDGVRCVVITWLLFVFFCCCCRCPRLVFLTDH